MDQKPIYIFAKWQVKQGLLDKVLRLLTEVATQSIAEKGNLFYKIHQGHADIHTLILFEGYSDDIALEAHRNSDYFKNLVTEQIVPALESREVIPASLLDLY